MLRHGFGRPGGFLLKNLEASRHEQNSFLADSRRWSISLLFVTLRDFPCLLAAFPNACLTLPLAAYLQLEGGES